MDSWPRRGELWEVSRGTGQGTLLHILDIPNVTPAENPYVVTRIAGRVNDERRIPLDERWGRSIVRVEGKTLDARQKIERQTAADRLTRIGIGNYGIEVLEDVLHKLLADFTAVLGPEELAGAIHNFEETR